MRHFLLWVPFHRQFSSRLQPSAQSTHHYESSLVITSLSVTQHSDRLTKLIKSLFKLIQFMPQLIRCDKNSTFAIILDRIYDNIFWMRELMRHWHVGREIILSIRGNLFVNVWIKFVQIRNNWELHSEEVLKLWVGVATLSRDSAHSILRVYYETQNGIFWVCYETCIGLIFFPHRWLFLFRFRVFVLNLFLADLATLSV